MLDWAVTLNPTPPQRRSSQKIKLLVKFVKLNGRRIWTSASETRLQRNKDVADLMYRV